MKFRPGILFQLGLLLLAAGMTSCVQTWPADREFQTHAALYAEDQGVIDDTLTVDEAINRIPAEPDFQQLHFDKTIDPACLKKPSGSYLVGPGDTLVVQVKVKEGSRERLQAFEGVCIANERGVLCHSD